MNGIEIISVVEKELISPWTGFGVPILLFVILFIFFHFRIRNYIKYSGENVTKKALAITYIISILVFSCISIFLFAMFKMFNVAQTQSPQQYIIKVSDDVKLNEFCKNYDIISVNGDEYTVAEKTDN